MDGMWEHFFIVNIMYILSPAYIAVIVPCNVPDVLEFGPLGLCLSLERQWVPNCAYQMVSELESLGYRPLQIERGTLHPLGAGIRVFEN